MTKKQDNYRPISPDELEGLPPNKPNQVTTIKTKETEAEKTRRKFLENHIKNKLSEMNKTAKITPRFFAALERGVDQVENTKQPTHRRKPAR